MASHADPSMSRRQVCWRRCDIGGRFRPRPHPRKETKRWLLRSLGRLRRAAVADQSRSCSWLWPYRCRSAGGVLPAQSLSCHRTSNNARIATPHPHGVIFTREVGRLGVPQLVQLFLRGIIETRGDVGLDIAAAHQSLEIGTGLGLLRDHLRRELSSRPCCLSLPRSCSSAILAAAISSMSLVAASLTKSAAVGLIPRVELVLWRMSADALEARDGVRQERRFRLDLSDRCDGGQDNSDPERRAEGDQNRTCFHGKSPFRATEGANRLSAAAALRRRASPAPWRVPSRLATCAYSA
jgi:hypothetical protein